MPAKKISEVAFINLNHTNYGKDIFSSTFQSVAEPHHKSFLVLESGRILFSNTGPL